MGPGDLSKYAASQEEVSFAHALAPYPLAKQLPPPPSFAARGEAPPVPHVPAYLPAFPDPHTFATTPAFQVRHWATHWPQARGLFGSCRDCVNSSCHTVAWTWLPNHESACLGMANFFFLHLLKAGPRD